MLGPVNKEVELENNPFFNWNPMETLQTRSHVLTSWDSKHQSSSCILHPLQLTNLTDWESTVQRVKRIQFRCEKSTNHCLKCISVQEYPDAADIVKLMESTLAHLPDLLVHAHSLIKDYPNSLLTPLVTPGTCQWQVGAF